MKKKYETTYYQVAKMEEIKEVLAIARRSQMQDTEISGSFLKMKRLGRG